VEEILRYEPPSPANARYAVEDVEFHGQTIPAGSVVLLIDASANHDDRQWGNGDVLDVNRKIDHHLSFGFGIHFCLGASLARMEGRVALDEVIKRFPDWEVDPSRMVRSRTSTVRGFDSLPVFVR